MLRFLYAPKLRRIDTEKCFDINCEIITGHVVNEFLLTALMSALGLGEKKYP